MKKEFTAATDAVCAAFKTALDSNMDQSTLGEVWRHYQGLRSITDSLPADNPLDGIQLQQDFGTATVGNAPLGLEFYENGAVAAGSVDLTSGGQDVITFGS